MGLAQQYIAAYKLERELHLKILLDSEFVEFREKLINQVYKEVGDFYSSQDAVFYSSQDAVFACGEFALVEAWLAGQPSPEFMNYLVQEAHRIHREDY